MNKKQATIAERIKKTKLHTGAKHGPESETEPETEPETETWNEQRIKEAYKQTKNITKPFTQRELEMFNLAAKGDASYEQLIKSKTRKSIVNAARDIYSKRKQEQQQNALAATSPQASPQASPKADNASIDKVKHDEPLKIDELKNEASPEQNPVKTQLIEKLDKSTYVNKSQFIDEIKKEDNGEILNAIQNEIDFIFANFTSEEPMRDEMFKRLNQLFDERDAYTPEQFKTKIDEFHRSLKPKEEKTNIFKKGLAWAKSIVAGKPLEEPSVPKDVMKENTIEAHKPLHYDIAKTDVEETFEDLEQVLTSFAEADAPEGVRKDKISHIIESRFTADGFKTHKDKIVSMINDKCAKKFGFKLVAKKKAHIDENGKLVDIKFEYLNDSKAPKDKESKVMKGRPYNSPSSKHKAKLTFSYDINDVFNIIENNLAINLSEQAKLEIDSIIKHAVNDVSNKTHGTERIPVAASIDETVSLIEDYINERSKSGESFAFTGQWREKLVAVLEREFIGIRASDEQISKNKRRSKLNKTWSQFYRKF